MYVAVPIQQGTHITDLLIYYFWGTIVCHIFGLPGCTNRYLVCQAALKGGIPSLKVALAFKP
jgi:hypothetical protein